MKRKVTALALTVALSALTLSGCAQLPQFPQRQSTEESTGEETTEGTTEESTESSSEETTEETSETSGTSESTEENNGTTLSDAEAAAVGTYIGGNGSCFTLHEDASCSFFDLNSDNVQQGLTWSISGGKINIVWRSAGLILTFDVPESSDTPIEVTGNNSSWNAELFAKVSDNARTCFPFRILRRAMTTTRKRTYPQALRASTLRCRRPSGSRIRVRAARSLM